MKTSTGERHEPPMYLQRPSSGKSQDVRHILASTFRELFTRDAVAPDKVKKLKVSKDGGDVYHERYVAALQKVHEERQKRHAEAAMLEKHIMQAQARAMSADERQLNRVSGSCEKYSDLGLPPERSHLRSCIDTELLRRHHLITPMDYAIDEQMTVPPPQESSVPSYARDTITSQQHSLRNEGLDESPLPSNRSGISGDLPSFLSEDGSDDLSLPPIAGQKLHENDSWKNYLNTEQREMDRFNLGKMQAKTNYARNLRHVPPSAPPGARNILKQYVKKPKEIGIQPKLEVEKPKEPSLLFLASPPVVTFSDYKVGKVYEIILELQNVSTVLRQCRTLPTSTPFFNVGLGQFPGEHGLVAPGMSCHYSIKFAPDSLKDFDDEIKVQTQSRTALVIPLRGRREPPVLTLPSEINVGYCLVGGVLVTQFAVKNTGGRGSFCFMPRSSWPASSFKSSVGVGTISLPPFEIRPSVLELQKGETGIIEVFFSPPIVKTYVEELTVICDNCQVRHLTIKGISERAAVELESVEGGISSAVPGELVDLTAQHLIRFEDLNPYTYTDKTITVRNNTHVPLPFHWTIFKPLVKPVADGDSDVSANSDRVVDIASVFNIEPAIAVLPPSDSVSFKIMFAPPAISSFNNVLHMLLQRVPPTSDGDRSNDGASANQTDDASSESYVTNDTSKLRSVCALEIEVKGSSVPLNVLLQPYAIFNPGQLLVGTTIRKTFMMANHSLSTITFIWDSYSKDHILEVEPPFGELDAGMALDLELSITGAEPGKLDHTLFCHVENLADPLPLHVEASVKGPEICIEDPDVNFGLVRIGKSATREITIANLSQITTRWGIIDSPDIATSDNPMAVSEFTFSPASGELPPLGRRAIAITFTPTTVQAAVKRVFELSVEDGNECNIAAFAEVQSAEVCLLSCELWLDKVYKGVPVVGHVTLMNQSQLSTTFEWGELEGSHKDLCDIEMSPQHGSLSPREQLEVKVNFTARSQCEISDVLIPCRIAGMSTPLYLTIFCDVRGLSLTYRVTKGEQEEECRNKRFDFGEIVPRGTAPKMYLCLKNTSAIAAPYSVNIEHFTTRPPTPPEMRNTLAPKLKSHRQSLVTKTPNLADPNSKTPNRAHAELCQTMLRDGRGACFLVRPADGILEPFSEAVIEFTALADMWGSYTDTAICKVGDLSPKTFPLSLEVIGCPLKFQLTAAQSNQAPVVRFGTHISGVSPISRTIKINNSSPLDVRLDVEVYSSTQEADRLLDCIVSFGTDFPVRDSKGTEVIPSLEAPEPVRRLPTDMLPDSVDSTPMISREVTQSTSPESKPAEPRKLVSLYLRPHDGMRADNPYDIHPKQMVIPARGHALTTIKFTPFPPDQVPEGVDCNGYVLGYMTLDSRAAEQNVTRKFGYQVEPLKLEMTAHVKPALLSIECTDEEGMRYRAAMSDLMRDQTQLLPECMKSNTVQLSNQTETPLIFRMRVKKPFLLVDLDPGQNAASRTRKTELHTLNPQHTIMVKVAFVVTQDLLQVLDDLDNEHDGIRLDVIGGERKLQFQKDLTVEFSNGSIQKIPLHATLSIPSIELSKEELDFGTCFVGQQRQQEFIIQNKTASHSYWSATIESRSESSLANTFTVLPSTGHLEAYITHISNSRTLIKVNFTAKHAEQYDAVFIFQGIFGEEVKHLRIRAVGSYDGKHEAVLNI